MDVFSSVPRVVERMVSGSGKFSVIGIINYPHAVTRRKSHLIESYVLYLLVTEMLCQVYIYSLAEATTN